MKPCVKYCTVEYDIPQETDDNEANFMTMDI